MQVFTLSSVPPTLNTMFPTAGKARVKSAAYRAWRTSAAWEIKAQRPIIYDGPIAVAVEMRRPTANSDIDNRIKAALDLLTGLAFHDDRQVHLVSACWSENVDGTRITVDRMEG